MIIGKRVTPEYFNETMNGFQYYLSEVSRLGNPEKYQKSVEAVTHTFDVLMRYTTVSNIDIDFDTRTARMITIRCDDNDSLLIKRYRDWAIQAADNGFNVDYAAEFLEKYLLYLEHSQFEYRRI